MTTNTYHGQTAKFIAKVAENVPHISAQTMQNWIENPNALRKALDRALVIPRIEDLIEDLIRNEKEEHTLWFDSGIKCQVNWDYHLAGGVDTLQAEMLEKAKSEAELFGRFDSKQYAQTLTQTVDPSVIMNLIAAQSKGEEGPLLVNGNPNIFLANYRVGQLHILLLDWHDDYRKWGLRCYRFNPIGVFGAGERLFRKAT